MVFDFSCLTMVVVIKGNVEIEILRERWEVAGGVVELRPYDNADCVHYHQVTVPRSLYPASTAHHTTMLFKTLDGCVGGGSFVWVGARMCGRRLPIYCGCGASNPLWGCGFQLPILVLAGTRLGLPISVCVCIWEGILILDVI